MRIDNKHFSNISKLYQTYQAQNAQPGKKPGINAADQDALQLSDKAKRIHELIKETKELPDVREDKIAQLKEQIANNTYNVTPQQLAAKMLSVDKE